MEIIEIAEQVKNKEEFIDFLKSLLIDYRGNKEEWENPNLERYLAAMERFLVDSNEQSINKIDFTPSWSMFAKIMVAATIYE